MNATTQTQKKNSWYLLSALVPLSGLYFFVLHIIYAVVGDQHCSRAGNVGKAFVSIVLMLANLWVIDAIIGMQMRSLIAN